MTKINVEEAFRFFVAYKFMPEELKKKVSEDCKLGSRKTTRRLTKI